MFIDLLSCGFKREVDDKTTGMGGLLKKRGRWCKPCHMLTNRNFSHFKGEG